MKAFTLHAIQRPRDGGGFDVHPVGSIIEIDKGLFADLKAVGAVREPRETEVAPVAPAAEVPAMSPQHRGSGRWVVVDQSGTIVSDDLFDSKDHAQAWIDAPAVQAEAFDD